VPAQVVEKKGVLARELMDQFLGPDLFYILGPDLFYWPRSNASLKKPKAALY
jgi:hypothetical protein